MAPRSPDRGAQARTAAPPRAQAHRALSRRRRSGRWRAEIPLDRDPARLILWLLIRLGVGEIGLVAGLRTPGTLGTAVVIASAVVIGYVVLLSIHVLSLRVELFRGEMHVASWLTRRRYQLADGAVTRLRLPPRQSWFGTQLGSFGIEIGLGLLRGRDEELEVLRLAPNSPMIVVPCIGTRLAITPSSEERFVRALATAAGVEQPANLQPERASR